MFFNNSKAVLAKLSMVVLALTIAGCEPAKPKAGAGTGTAGHDHDGEHAHAETLEEAVKELQGICASVKSAFDKNDAEAADEPMHDVFHLIEEVKELTKTSKLSDADKLEVDTAANNLLDAFDALHEGMHGGTTSKKYTDVADAIDASLKTLSEKAKS